MKELLIKCIKFIKCISIELNVFEILQNFWCHIESVDEGEQYINKKLVYK